MKALLSYTNSLCIISIMLLTGNLSSNNYTEEGAVVFIENKGQVMNQNRMPRPEVLFVGETEGMFFNISAKGISYQLTRIDNWSKIISSKSRVNKATQYDALLIPEDISIFRTDIEWINPNPNFKIVLGEELPGSSNFYNVPTGSKPALNVKQYKSVIFKNIWEGVDLVYYNRDGHLESDWVVKNPLDYQKIAFEIKGANLSITEGNLLINTPFGTIQEGSLIAYQGDIKTPCEWVVNNNNVSIQLENLNPVLPLIIDPPVRVWGTYLGGSASDRVTDLTADDDGNSILTGFSMSLQNIATDGAHQSTFGGGIQDAFLARFDSEGVRVWSSYFGGESNEAGQSCGLDNLGHVYIAGETRSTTNVATINAHQVLLGGEFDAYLAKFDLQNGELVWASYFGGAQFESCWDLQADNSGNIYLCGITDSENSIASANSHQSEYSGGFGDGYIAKFGSDGQLLWSSYYGGDQYDEAYGVASDALGNVYLTGLTYSENQIASPGSHQESFGGEDDIFLIKFNGQGVRQWGTYIGGESFDEGFACTVDAENNVYVAGGAASVSGISTTGAHQFTFNNQRDAFLVKFAGSGDRIWGTYYGGERYENFWRIHINNQGFIYAGGQTNSISGIANSNGYQTTFGGGSDDGFLTKFSSSGLLSWGTYIGGGNYDDLYGIATDNSFNVYVGGGTQSTEGISTPGSFQSEIASSSDGYVIKLFDQEETPTYFEDSTYEAKILVYPNPAGERIQIYSPTAGLHVRINDLAGREFFNEYSINQFMNISLEYMHSGIYLLEIGQGEKMYFQKIIIGK